MLSKVTQLGNKEKPCFWILKSEPSTYSIDHIATDKNQTTVWEGVRNYQARNFLRRMKKGDLAFFYHSSCATPAIVGIVEIVQAGLVDTTAFDPTSPYYDPKSTPTSPRWFMVKVKLKEKFSAPLPLQALRENPKLSTLILLRKGNRLSVIPLTPLEWRNILSMRHSDQ